MSSHREAPESSKDPTADSTDVYAFVSPDAPSTVTLIANYIPFESPDGGPNFYEFGTDVQYDINVDNDGDGLPNITFRFRFSETPNANGGAAADYFLYNTGQITAPTGGVYPNYSRPQTYTLTRIDYTVGSAPVSTVLGTNLIVPPCNVGPLSTPNYESALASPAVQQFASNSPGYTGKVFAGQRAEGFYVDLGAVFDLGNLRPFQTARTGTPFTSTAMGVNSTDRINVHSLALQVPIAQLTSTKTAPTNPTLTSSVIGVWTAASRQKVRIYGSHTGETVTSGPFVQVSRLGNPLINELVIPLSKKDLFNTQPPVKDSQFATYFSNPGLAQLLPALYTVFPHLGAYNAANPPPNNARADLVAILLTGIPTGVIAANYSTYTGPVQADMLRLNVAIAPTTTNPSNLGVLGNDFAGYPNGRRVFDDVATIELRAVAGATLSLVKTYTADAAAGAVDFGLTFSGTDRQASGGGSTAVPTEYYLSAFPYLAVPHSGYDASTPVAATGGSDDAGAATGPLAASGA
jgi:hypothetical protein